MLTLFQLCLTSACTKNIARYVIIVYIDFTIVTENVRGNLKFIALAKDNNYTQWYNGILTGTYT